MTRKEFLIIAISCLAAVVIWAVFDIIHSNSKVKENPKIEELIRPIDPNLGVDGLNFNE